MTSSRLIPAGESPEVSRAAKLTYAILGSLVVMALVGTGAGMTMDTMWHVERQLVIDAPPSALLGYVDTPSRHPQWLGWDDDEDPTLRRWVEGPERGPGATARWEGRVFGTGWARVESVGESDAGGWRITLRGQLFGSIPTLTTVAIAPDDDHGSVLTLTDEGTLPRPHGPFFRAATERRIDAHLAGALERLAEVAEGRR